MVFHVKGIKSLSHLLLLFNPYMRFQPNVVDLRYFNFWILLDNIILIWKSNVYTIRVLWYRNKFILWQRLNSFVYLRLRVYGASEVIIKYIIHILYSRLLSNISSYFINKGSLNINKPQKLKFNQVYLKNKDMPPHSGPKIASSHTNIYKNFSNYFVGT